MIRQRFGGLTAFESTGVQSLDGVEAFVSLPFLHGGEVVRGGEHAEDGEHAIEVLVVEILRGFVAAQGEHIDGVTEIVFLQAAVLRVGQAVRGLPDFQVIRCGGIALESIGVDPALGEDPHAARPDRIPARLAVFAVPVQFGLGFGHRCLFLISACAAIALANSAGSFFRFSSS